MTVANMKKKLFHCIEYSRSYEQMGKQKNPQEVLLTKIKHITGSHTTGTGKKIKIRFYKSFLRIASFFNTVRVSLR